MGGKPGGTVTRSQLCPHLDLALPPPALGPSLGRACSPREQGRWVERLQPGRPLRGPAVLRSLFPAPPPTAPSPSPTPSLSTGDILSKFSGHLTAHACSQSGWGRARRRVWGRHLACLRDVAPGLSRAWVPLSPGDADQAPGDNGNLEPPWSSGVTLAGWPWEWSGR